MKNKSFALFFLITACCIFVFHAANAEADEMMKVGYRVLAPHSLLGKSETEPTGAAVEYMETYIAPKMQVDIKWSFLPFLRLIKYLDEGKIDAVLLLGKNSKRLKKYFYPAKPLTSENSGLALKKTNPLTQVNTVDDLKDITIGFTKGGFLSPFMRDKQIRFDFTVGGENTWRQLLMKLDKGRFDAAYNPTLLALKYEAKLLGIEKKLKFIELPEPPIDLYLVFSSSSATLYKKFDAIHTTIQEGISYEELLKKYLE